MWVWLEFNGPLLRSIRAGHLSNHTPDLASSSMRLTSTFAHSFARNWQLPFLNQRKEENDRWNYFMINLHEWMLPATAWLQVGRAPDWATKADKRSD